MGQSMKRAVLCVENPHDYIPQLNDYSIMIINPNSTEARNQYLLDNSDYSLLVTDKGYVERNGGDYPNERVLWYTSGTTGDSKFCSFSQSQIDAMAARICRTYNITENDRYTSIMPLWHAHGQGFYWATKLARCQVDYLTMKDVRKMPYYAPTFITAIPDVLKVIAQLDFKGLRFIRGASAGLPDTLFTKIKHRFNVPVIEAFGMTEALSHCFTNPLNGVRKMGTIGLPDGIEADLVEGKLFIRGNCLFKPGWYDTGDLAEQDEQGYFKIVGRSRDQISVKGIKVNPLSIEEKMRGNIDCLEDCVVFGTDAVKVLYVGDCDPVEIRNYLMGLGPQCKPALLERVDSIPVSPSGKISRTWLADRY